MEHFRNYAALELPVGPGMHVFAGANAQGKTNLLEAVYLAATGHSPRTGQESELIGWGQDIARVTTDVNSERRGLFTIEVALRHKAPAGSDEMRRSGPVEKRIKVNGVARSAANLAGLAPVVLFLVDDLEIIRGEPARRRAFLDTDLSLMSRTYQHLLKQYTRVLDQRNRLLKDVREGTADPLNLLPWDEQLAVFGGRLLEVRLRFLRDLNRETAPVYRGLSASEQELTISYLRAWGDPKAEVTTREAGSELLLHAIDTMKGEEIRRGVSLVGPHRDDLLLLIDGRDIRHFGSQGEQRTAALALRVAECALQGQLVGEPPVLLLDDILSELDRRRRAALLEHLVPMAQVILTTTDVDAVGLPPNTDVHLHQVAHGTVAPMA